MQLTELQTAVNKQLFNPYQHVFIIVIIIIVIFISCMIFNFTFLCLHL